jgi:hypothetical protein
MSPDEEAPVPDDPSDVRRHLEQWIAEVSATARAFEWGIPALQQAGCDPLKLGWLLSALANAQRWRPISRERLRDDVRDLHKAANAVRRLFFSQLNQRLGLDSLRLEGELRMLARRARELVPQVHQRRPMGRDLVRAAIVCYVSETTGQFHDGVVAALIDAAESMNIDGDRGTAGVRQSVQEYTIEAHVQWRRRDSARELLDGPSQAVQDLKAAMAEDLGP